MGFVQKTKHFHALKVKFLNKEIISCKFIYEIFSKQYYYLVFRNLKLVDEDAVLKHMLDKSFKEICTSFYFSLSSLPDT